MPEPIPQGPTYKKKYKTHVVRQGATSWNAIANQYGVPVSALAAANQGASLVPGLVVKIPQENKWGASANEYGVGVQTPFGGFNIPIGGATGGVRTNQLGGRGYYRPSQTDWINPVTSLIQKGVNYLGSNVNNVLRSWGDPYRVGMGDVQRANFVPSPQQTTAQQFGLSTGRTLPGYMTASAYTGAESRPYTGTSEATTPAQQESGNHQEKLPYGKSYNYSVNTGEIANPGSAAAVNYGDDAVYNLSRAMVDGYGYDYGNYLKWASENNIQQPASYYSWRSTQGITRSGQSTQFWEYMQGLQMGQQAGGSAKRRNTQEMLEYKEAKKNDPSLTYRKWKAGIGTAGKRPGHNPYAVNVVEEEEENGTPAVQPYISYTGNRYNAPSSFGLVTWRT